MYIAGSYDDMQGGICYGGIAHAGPPRYKRAMWFDKTDNFVNAASLSGILSEQYFLLVVSAYIHSDITTQQFIFSNRQNAGTNTGYSVAVRNGNIEFRRGSTSPGVRADAFTSYTLAAYNATGGAGLIVNTTISPYGTRTIGFGAEPVNVGARDNGVSPFGGVVYDVRLYSVGGLSVAQIQAIALAPDSATPAMWLKGNGVTDADWIDHGSESIHHGTVYDSPDPAYIRGDGKVIVNGEIKNP